MGTWARIVLDSLHPTNGARLTTLELNYPYIVHAELMTHSIFSRNAASLRAIKTKHMIERVRNDPFIPARFPRTANPDKGMEPDGYFEPGSMSEDEARMYWLRGLNNAIDIATRLSRMGVHKQIASRPLAPYMYQRTLVTSTEWENWDNLRGATRDTGAQDQIQELARGMYQARLDSKPQERWTHLPFVSGIDDGVEYSQRYPFDEFMVSAGRCARISYLNHDGKAQPDKDEDLGNRLKSSGHMSPFAHLGIAQPDRRADQWSKNFRGWINFRETLPGEAVWRPDTTST